MMWNLPITVNIDGTEYAIRNKCDYRVVLDVIAALNDEELEMDNRVRCALFIFYEDLTGCKDIETAVKEMMRIVNNGEEQDKDQPQKPQIMDWEYDFKQIAPPISRVLGYSVRSAESHTHWYDFVGAYMEIGECTFANIVSIRFKKQKRIPLEKWEQDFYRENQKIIDLPCKITAEEEEMLNSDW